MFFLEVYPNEDLFINITYDDEIKLFEITVIPSYGETFKFELDTEDEYAVLAKASVYGAMTVTYAGFIPLGMLKHTIKSHACPRNYI